MSRILPLLSIGLLVLAPTASSIPAVSRGEMTIKQCIDLEVPVSIEADQWLYDQPRVDSNIDAMDWTVNVTTHGVKFSKYHMGKNHIDQPFKISAQLCIPSQKSNKSSILQIATPGQGFDKRLVMMNTYERSFLEQ